MTDYRVQFEVFEGDVLTAVVTSLAAVRHNPGTLAVWAGLIVLFSGAGLVTAYLGLVITLPLIGHASWHAYKNLVVFTEQQAR